MVTLVLAGFFCILFGAFWQKFIIGAPPLDGSLIEIPKASDVPVLVKSNPYVMTELVHLPVSPLGAKIVSRDLVEFNFTLSDQFLIDGEP